MMALVFPALLATAVPQVVRTSGKTVTCALPKPCALFENTSSGPALKARAARGAGILATTSSGSYDLPGLEGESANVTGNDAAAAFGLEFLTLGTAPTYGATAYGVLNGLYGATENGGASPDAYAAGVFGQDEAGAGASSYYGVYNAGVVGTSDNFNGTGVLAEANGSPAAESAGGVYGDYPVGLYAVGEPATNAGYGVVGESDNTAVLAVDASQQTSVALASNASTLVNALSFAGTAGYADFYVDVNGNGNFSGTVTTSKGTYARTRGASGATRIAYASRGASPQIVDVGEGRLVGGCAYVAIDPDLADSLDMRRPYHVFVTPEDDSKQLYVAEKSRSGFVVRESGGGRSTLAFDYRIVGKPFDDDSPRFAAAPPLEAPTHPFGHAGIRRSRVTKALGIPSVALSTPASQTVKCATAAPCELYDNTSAVKNASGQGIVATSAQGIGVAASSASGNFLTPGIEGEATRFEFSDSGAGFGLAYVKGSAPTYGALSYGASNGLYGETTNSGSSFAYAGGVAGEEVGTSRVDDNAGVLGASAIGTGVLGEANGTPTNPNYFGNSAIGAYGVAFQPQNQTFGDGGADEVYAVGVVAESADGGGVALVAFNPQADSSVQLVTGSSMIDSSYGDGHFSVDINGNGAFTGTFTTENGTFARTRGASGKSRIAYGARATVPEIEDVGEALLIGGRAEVTFDPAFADSIDMRRPYQVFITPEGDSRGLYVARKSPNGFVVRESHGARSTLAFDYRIVGRAIDDAAPRLASAPAEPRPPLQPSVGVRPHFGTARSPQARLRLRLGAQAYARALLAKRNALVSKGSP